MDQKQSPQLKQQQHQEPFQPAATFNELLINEVRAHPQLYDQQHRVCTDNLERNNIWETIASRIDPDVSGEFAKKRWLQMRDRYRKELKMALRTSIQPKWPYFPKLSWLDPYLKDAKNIKSGTTTPLSQQSSMNLADFGSPQSGGPFAESKDFLTDHLRFPQLGHTVNLLETLMAASNAILNSTQQQKTDLLTSSGGCGDFSSPDSAVASTSDGDADPNHHHHQLGNNNNNSCGNLLLRASTLMGLQLQQQQNQQQRTSTGGTTSSTTNTADGEEEEMEIEGGKEEQEDGGSGCDADDNLAKGDEDDDANNIVMRDHSTPLLNSAPLKLQSTKSSASASVQMPPVDFTALFAANSPLHLLNASIASTPSNNNDDDHNNHGHGNSSRSPTTPTRHRNSNSNSGGVGAARNNPPPYLVRRGIGGSKYRSRLGSISHSSSANENSSSCRKFDIVSMCTTNPPPPSCVSVERDHPSAVEDGGEASWSRMEWDNDDEDLLFARLIVARLKKFGPRERRTIRARIFQWLDQKEEDGEQQQQALPESTK